MKKMRTADVIAQTVFELLERKEISEIKVSEIADEVGVSTRTFYNCFSDKYEVCNYIYDQLLDRYCWQTDGRRSTLKQFFDSLLNEISGSGKYSMFIKHTTCYTGQNCIMEHIISRGTEDLKQQLVYTGHEDLLTPETVIRLEFYMRGLTAILQQFINAKASLKQAIMQLDQTSFLPQDINAALTAEPVYAVIDGKKRAKKD